MPRVLGTIAALFVATAALDAQVAQSYGPEAYHQDTVRGTAQVPHSVQRPAPPPPAPPPPLPPRSVPPPTLFPFQPLMPPVAGGLPPRGDEGAPFRTFPPLQSSFGLPFYPFALGYPEPMAPMERSYRRIQPPPVTGFLRLWVTPTSARVFVDSYYAGTVEDINARGALELEAGPHRIEIRAPQYDTLTVDVRIEPYQTVTYRGALELTRAPAVPSPPSAGARAPMYLIPNCYLGNVPPRPSRLPAGCNVKDVQVVGPK